MTDHLARLTAEWSPGQGVNDAIRATREARIETENTILRGWLAKLAYAGKIPCHYCGLVDPVRCWSGFPGCGLADDLLAYEDEVPAGTWIEKWLGPL